MPGMPITEAGDLVMRIRRHAHGLQAAIGDLNAKGVGVRYIDEAMQVIGELNLSITVGNKALSDT